MTSYLTFLEHLDELRKRLFISVLAVATGMAGSFFFVDRLIELLFRPIRAEMNELYFFSPSGAFTVKLQVVFIAGFLLASPIVMSQLWLFLSPALARRERNFIVPIAAATSLFFVAGSAFAFYAVVPMTLQFLLGLQTEFLRPMISVESYVSFLLQMTLAFGLAFNLPVFILALVSAGIFSAAQLAKVRRQAVVLILIIAAVLTPGPDIASQFALALPLLFLFEISVVGAKALEFFRRKQVKTTHV